MGKIEKRETEKKKHGNDNNNNRSYDNNDNNDDIIIIIIEWDSKKNSNTWMISHCGEYGLVFNTALYHFDDSWIFEFRDKW